MKVEGQCHCGKIAFEAKVDPGTVSLCHCTDCQTMTGSAYRISVAAPAASFVLKSGQPKTYIKTTADSGNKRLQAFCPDCGTPLYASNVVDPPTYTLRVGSLRQRTQLKPARQIWCRSAQPWSMDVTDVPKFEREAKKA